MLRVDMAVDWLAALRAAVLDFPDRNAKAVLADTLYGGHAGYFPPAPPDSFLRFTSSRLTLSGGVGKSSGMVPPISLMV